MYFFKHVFFQHPSFAVHKSLSSRVSHHKLAVKTKTLSISSTLSRRFAFANAPCAFSRLTGETKPHKNTRNEIDTQRTVDKNEREQQRRGKLMKFPNENSILKRLTGIRVLPRCCRITKCHVRTKSHTQTHNN